MSVPSLFIIISISYVNLDCSPIVSIDGCSKSPRTANVTQVRVEFVVPVPELGARLCVMSRDP